jgi:hypothetical protein
MNASREKYYRGMFLIAAVYDLVLGVIFAFLYKPAFAMLGITDRLPNYPAYLSLLGAFVLVLGVAYFLIYRGDLRRNRDLILVGTLYKLAYCSTGIFYSMAGGVPHPIFMWLFGVADFVFLVLMVECLVSLRKSSPA